MNKLLLIIFVFFAGPGNNPSKIIWNTSFSHALNSAQKEDKHILLYFSGSDWCKPCIKMKTYVLDTPEFTDFAEDQFILLQADFPRLKKNRLSDEQTAHNEMLAEKYNISGVFPLLVVLNKEGKILQKIEYRNQTCEQLIEHLKPFQI